MVAKIVVQKDLYMSNILTGIVSYVTIVEMIPTVRVINPDNTYTLDSVNAEPIPFFGIHEVKLQIAQQTIFHRVINLNG